jgi:unsaturated rhamnogalacturonyl hydrolase
VASILALLSRGLPVMSPGSSPRAPRHERWASRRHTLRLLLCLGAAIACRAEPATNAKAVAPLAVMPVGPAAGESTTTPNATVGWDAVSDILQRIRPPTFPARECNIVAYGAAPGGSQDSTPAIRRAVADCAAQGGGRVLVPPGVFSSGAIHLQSNIELHVAEGATLRFSPDPAMYLPVVLTRWEGIECMSYSSLIYARDAENVAITGQGTLDGSAGDDNWWRWARREPGQKSLAAADIAELNRMSEQNVPVEQRVFGAGHYLRPNFIQIYSSRNVLIENVKIVRSPMWEIHPVLSENVTVRGVEIVSHGPNNDGCNPDSSKDVLIENCLFDVGDDCIAIKSGRNEDGRRIGRAVENVIVRGSTMRDGHAGVAIGSEISGGARNIFIENNRMDSPHLDRALRLKSNARRGGIIDGVYLRNGVVGQVSEALLTIDFQYEEGPHGDFPPTARNVWIENVRAERSPRLFYISGFPGATIDSIHVRDTQILNATATEVIEHAGRIELENVTITPAVKPRSLSSRRLVE